MCRFCLNARVCDDLTDDNDLSFLVSDLMSCYDGVGMWIVSGNGEPVHLDVERRIDGRWVTIASYRPKFCPECGRNLEHDYD